MFELSHVLLEDAVLQPIRNELSVLPESIVQSFSLRHGVEFQFLSVGDFQLLLVFL